MYLAVYNSCLEILDRYKHHAGQEEFQQGAEILITTAVKSNQLKAVKWFLDHGIIPRDNQIKTSFHQKRKGTIKILFDANYLIVDGFINGQQPLYGLCASCACSGSVDP